MVARLVRGKLYNSFKVDITKRTILALLGIDLGFLLCYKTITHIKNV